MPTYPDTKIVINGQRIEWSRLANNPTLLQRALNTLAQQRLIGPKLLAGRVDLTGSGVAVFEQSEAIFAKFPAERIAPLMEYPTTQSDRGPIATVQASKWGFGEDVPDELVARNRGDEIARKLIKMVNQQVFQFDALVLAAVSSAVTQTFAGAAVWGTTAATPFADLLTAAATVDSLNKGYVLDTVALSPLKFAALASSPAVLAGMQREGTPFIETNASSFSLAGMTYVKTTNMPSGVLAIAMDSSMLGSIGYEDLGGGYVGSPTEVQSKQFRLDKNDGLRIQTRLVQVPLIREPGAAIKITGI